MPRGEVKRALRERQILDAAYVELRAQGYVAMSMDDVARACGIGKATLYQHFSSKDELVVAVIVDTMLSAERLHDEIPADLPALERLSRVLLVGVERRTSVAPIHIAQIPDSISHHPAFQAQMARMFGQMAALIEEGKARGEVRQDIDTRMIVAHLMNTFGPGLDVGAERVGCTPRALAEQWMPLVLGGLGARA
jgi:AcrR family transcriptional regulator